MMKLTNPNSNPVRPRASPGKLPFMKPASIPDGSPNERNRIFNEAEEKGYRVLSFNKPSELTVSLSGGRSFY